MVAIHRSPDAGRCRFVLRPNRSMSWGANLRFFLILCVVSAGIAITLAALGYWLVMPFTGIELAAVGAALYAVARRCSRCEVISVQNDEVRIEKGRRTPARRWTLDRAWARARLERDSGGWYPSRLVIRSRGRRVEIGRFLNEEERVRLAAELSRVLRTTSPASAPPPSAPT